MTPDASRRTQVKRWLLVLLVLGHEAHVMANVLGANASEPRALRHDIFAAPKWLDAATLRRLQVALGGDWTWPTGSSLLFSWKKGSGNAIEVVQTKGVDTVEVVASLVYDKMEISTEDPNMPIGAAHTSPAVKLVQGTADRTLCQSSAYDVPVGKDAIGNAGDLGKTNGALSLTNSGNLLTNSQVNIIFMQGGQYKLCYTPDGTFGGNDGSEVNNNVVATMIKVYGVSGPCTTDGCLENERWECWFGYKGESVPSHCQFNFQYDGGRVGWAVETGQASRITWTPAFGADTEQGGTVTYSPQLCAANDADLSLFDLANGVSRYMDVTSQSTATMPSVKSTHSSAFTMAACYCPNYDAERGEHCTPAHNTCCDSFAEFIQQFGVLYYWTIRICDYQYYTTCMPTPTGNTPSYRYMRVVPQQKFTLRVDCPPGGGCTNTNDNRVTFIGQLPSNDRPSWDANAGCRTYTASINAVWPSSQDTGAIGGGVSRYYKAWREKQVKINLSLKRGLDVCYCNSNPQSPSSWFKVGTVSTTSAFAFASQTLPDGGAITPIETIKYVGHPGSVTLYGGIMGLDPSLGNFPSPFESNMYSGKAVVNIMSFDREVVDGQGALQRTLMEQFSYDAAKPLDFQSQMDSQCQKERYSLTLVTGPSSKQAARSYIAQVDATSDNTPSQYMSFSGSDKDQTMTVNLAGVVAICYCGMVSAENECESSLNWLFAGLMTIQGPEGGKTFIFPTNVVVKFDLKGWGFSPDDRLRIIPANAECSGTAQNPNNPDSDINFKVDCPAINGQGCRQATTSESIMTSVLTSSSPGVGIFIDRVDIQQTSSTLRFTGDISQHLGSDPEFGADIITLDLERIIVNGKDINSVSAIERFEANKLAGVFEFQDTYTNGPIQTYQVGHRVMSTPNYDQMTIPQGWVPTAADGEFYFTTSPFTFTDSKGHWTRRNKLETNEEIKGITAAPNLKLCWGIYSAGQTKFYHEAGKVNFVDPPAMASAVVSLTTKMQEAVAPVIIAFKTTDSRNEYSTPTGATMLMLRFLDVSRKFEPYWHNQENGIRGVYSIPDTQEVTKAATMQHVCGKIFLEFWSSHSEAVFRDVAYVSLPEARNCEDMTLEMVFVSTGCTAPRMLLHVGSGRSLKVIESHLSLDESDAGLCNGLCRVVADEDAQVRHEVLQLKSDSARFVESIMAEVASGALYQLRCVQSGASCARVNVAVALQGEKASCDVKAVMLADEKQQLDLHSLIHHSVPSCRSNQEHKNLVGGSAECIFKGIIKVDAEAQQTESAQIVRSLLLTKKSKVKAMPSLQIQVDEVTCSHGAALTQLDPEELFYLASRGLDAANARRLMLSGFPMDLLEGLKELMPKSYARVTQKLTSMAESNAE